MKIPPSHLQPQPTPDVNKPAAKLNASGNEAAAADEPGEAGGTAGRDFASVLEDVARPRERGQQEGDGEGERFDSQSRDRAEGETETRRREERQGGGDEGGDGRGGFDQRGGVREVAASQDAASARSILHIADLERIISAVRTQKLAGGVREITVELRRSVLEGLSVKLSLDGGGRVAAELIASSERVRAQLDARSAELAEILRSRGVNLASLRTSVGANVSGQDSQGGGGSSLPQPGAGAIPGLTSGAAAAEAADDIDVGAASAESDGTIYRA